MAEDREKLPLDAQLLSEAIIELNISRRNVTIYPEGHPSVERSLEKAFNSLQKLFEHRAEITIAIAKDTIIADDVYLDRKSPVIKEFALHLSGMNIVSVTFRAGLTKEELFAFHRLLSKNMRDVPVETVKEAFDDSGLFHIVVGFIDYSAFSFEEGRTEDEEEGEAGVWERYVRGLIEGTLQTGEVSDVLHEIPPGELAELVNKNCPGDLGKEASDRIVSPYMHGGPGGRLTTRELARVFDFIDKLRPELKKQFLSSAVKNVSSDIDHAEKALKGMSTDNIIKMLSTINEQQLTIPEALKNLLDKFSKLRQTMPESPTFEGKLIADDIFLSPDVISLLGGGNFEAFVSETYQQEIQKVLSLDISDLTAIKLAELNRTCSDEYIDRDFSQVLMEIISSDTVSEDEYAQFLDILKEESGQFIETGQYGEVLKLIDVLNTNRAEGKFPDLTSSALEHINSPEFIAEFIESLRIIGRQAREEAMQLCMYYGEEIISPLIDALITEDSQAVRRFLISLITLFGNKAIPVALKRISDSRWFVKRNILFILSECGTEEVLPHVRTYCHHENPKVSFEAIKCLLKTGDSYGINALKGYINSENRDLAEQAIALAGAFRVKDTVPDLIRILRKKAIGGQDIYEKIPVVKALGQIGDTRALAPFREILSVKSLLFKGIVDELKETIYRTLKNFPYEEVQDLVEKGLKSKNEVIRQESLKIEKARSG